LTPIPLILNIDTSGEATSVCLQKGIHILSQMEIHTGRGSSNQIFHLIQNCLDITNKKINDLNAVSVCVGPGSYTGLRVGLSVAKGIAYGLEVPMIGLNGMECMAHDFFSKNMEFDYCAIAIDARRDEIYFGMWDSNSSEIMHPMAAIVDESFIHSLSGYRSLAVIGNGADKVKQLGGNSLNAFFSYSHMRAVYMATLSLDKFHKKDFIDLRSAVPDYLKEFYSKNFVANS